MNPCNCFSLFSPLAANAFPDLDAGRWSSVKPPIAEGGHVSLHGLPPLVMVQVLFGVWRRAQDGVKTGDVSLRMACRALARQQVTTVEDCQASQVASKAARALLRSFARDARRALADPAAEQARDIWASRCSVTGGGSISPASPHRGCGRRPSGGQRRTFPAAGARATSNVRHRDQRHRPAVRKPACPARPRHCALRAEPPGRRELPEPSRLPGIAGHDQPLPAQQDLCEAHARS